MKPNYFKGFVTFQSQSDQKKKTKKKQIEKKKKLKKNGSLILLQFEMILNLRIYPRFLKFFIYFNSYLKSLKLKLGLISKFCLTKLLFAFYFEIFTVFLNSFFDVRPTHIVFITI